MKKFAQTAALAKAVLISVLAALALTACQKATLSSVETARTSPTASPASVNNSNAAAPTTSPLTTANDNISRPRSDPYTGDLSIFEDPKRDENLQINRVMDILKITAGKSVADIGAGSGWFSVRAAKRVGASGKVYAVEINQEYIKHIDERARRENFGNIQTVLGTEDNPKLPDDAVDAVLILKTYHEIGEPVKVLKYLKKSLRKDALIGIIDRNGSGGDHGIKKEVVVKELDRAGFKLVNDYDFVKPDGMDYFLVFQAEN